MVSNAELPDPGDGIPTEHHARTLVEEWLDYAAEVMGHGTHAEWCTDNRPSADERGKPYQVDLRWPGIIFEEYERGAGVLLVGNIHTHFDTSPGLTHTEAEHAYQVNREWQKRTISDREAVDELRKTYRKGLAAWQQQRPIIRLMQLLGLPFGQLAFVNGARCQGAGTCKNLQVKCLSEWPMARMLRMLQPAIVVLANATARDTLAELASLPSLTVSVNPKMQWCLSRFSHWQRPELIGEPFEIWAPIFAEAAASASS